MVGLVIVLFMRPTRTTIDDRGITIRSPAGVKRRVPWEDVARVDPGSGFYNWFEPHLRIERTGAAGRKPKKVYVPVPSDQQPRALERIRQELIRMRVL